MNAVNPLNSARDRLIPGQRDCRCFPRTKDVACKALSADRCPSSRAKARPPERRSCTSRPSVASRQPAGAPSGRLGRIPQHPSQRSMAARLSLDRKPSSIRTTRRLPQGVSMQPERRTPTHPGEILRADFLKPLGQSQVALAEHLGVSVQRINELVRGKRGVTPETAWLLSQALNTTPEFWLNLQTAFDLAVSRPARKVPKLRRAS